MDEVTGIAEAPDDKSLVKASTRVVLSNTGRVIDIAPALPFRMPVWQALRKQGVDPLRMARLAGKGELDLEPLEKIALAAIRLVEPHAPIDEIMNGLGFPDITNLAMAVLQAETSEIDRPTSTASSSLPNGGDGVLATLPN